MTDDDQPSIRMTHCDRFARQNCFERLIARKWDNLMKRRPGATGFYDEKTREGVIYWAVDPCQGIIMEVPYRNGYLMLPPRRRVRDDVQEPDEGRHDD